MFTSGAFALEEVLSLVEALDGADGFHRWFDGQGSKSRDLTMSGQSNFVHDKQ